MTAPTPDLPPLPEPATCAYVQGRAMQGGEYRDLAADYDESSARYSVAHMRAYVLADRAAGRALEAVPTGLSSDQEPKYTVNGSAIVNRASGAAIPADEPVFIFRARDRWAVSALRQYLHLVHGSHADAVAGRIREFNDFHSAHPERMKEPDTAPIATPAASPAAAQGSWREAFEALAKQWDGCEWEDVQDVGASLRSDFAMHLRASPAASQEEHVAIVEMYVTGPSSMTATLTQAGNLLARGLHKLYAHPALLTPVPADMVPNLEKLIDDFRMAILCFERDGGMATRERIEITKKALLAAGATPQPSADMVLVPREPTQEMMDAFEAAPEDQPRSWSRAYSDMLEAAPKLATTAQPAAPQRHPDTKRLDWLENAVCEQLSVRLCFAVDLFGEDDDPDVGDSLRAAIDKASLAQPSQPAETGERKPEGGRE